jgi:hypothetical protein
MLQQKISKQGMVAGLSRINFGKELFFEQTMELRPKI